MYRWHKQARKFLKKHRQALEERPVVVFALGPVHDPHDEEEWQDSWRQLRKELANYPWFRPLAIEMFGGKFDPDALRFPMKQLAGSAPATDIRDWDAIREWARDVAGRILEIGQEIQD
jgi:menaquinone-dependent protoporphyrinogen oxidase